MLNPQNIEAINNLSQGCKTVMYYALNDFKKDIELIDCYCKKYDANNTDMDTFHNTLAQHTTAMINAVALLSVDDQFSLVQHFAPSK